MWAAIPAIATAALSLWKPLWLARYLIVCLPPMVLLIARGLVLLRRRSLAMAAIAATIAVSLIATFQYSTRKEDWRGAMQLVLSNARPGDVALIAPYEPDPYKYYVDRLRPSIPAPRASDGSAVESKALLASGDSTKSVSDPLGENPRVWIVEGLLHPDDLEDPTFTSMITWLEANRHRAVDRSFYGLRVLLYD
jgi:hypothetical protein